MNQFSARAGLPGSIKDAALTLCGMSARIKTPIRVEIDDGTGSYAILLAVACDPKKIAQIRALVDSWG